VREEVILLQSDAAVVSSRTRVNQPAGMSRIYTVNDTN
jgi:hypothetical protein